LNGADQLVKCLEAENVRYVFGLPGEETIEINEALRSSSIQFLTVRHEQAAAFMAGVYGRLTGRAGVCLATLGPGATNLVTGIADATFDRAPLVALTGQVDQRKLHKESHQAIDIVHMLEPITKWTARITRTSIIPEAIRKSFKIAELEKPGACHLELPQDIANEVASGGPLFRGVASVPEPSLETLEKARRLIEGSRNPIILAGNGIVRGRASKALGAFASKLRIPVAETFMAKGVIPADNEFSLFTIGLQARDYVACGFDRADLVIAVGYDFVEYSPENWNPNGDKQILHVDASFAETDRSYAPNLEVIGDINTTLTRLAEHLQPKAGNYVRTLRELVLSETKQNANDTSFPVKPQRLVHDLREVLHADDIMVCDVGAHKLWIARLFPASAPNSVIMTNGLSSMGFALPGALAAKLLNPSKNVIAVCGDGGFLMSCQELETAKRLGLKIVVVIFRDNGYGAIKWKQMERYGHSSGVDFGNPDFQKLAESFGLEAYQVQSTKDTVPMLQKAMKADRAAIVEVPVDYKENLILSRHLGEIVCPI
jgi:acetolactate synthase-1/2/3 large subunit